MCLSYHHIERKGGGGGASCGEGRHHHIWVDGLQSVLRVHAQHRHLRKGQVAGMASRSPTLKMHLSLIRPAVSDQIPSNLKLTLNNNNILEEWSYCHVKVKISLFGFSSIAAENVFISSLFNHSMKGEVKMYINNLKVIFLPVCFFLCSVTQKAGGLMFPDRASLYVLAIEDRQYKDFKIHCKSITQACLQSNVFPPHVSWEPFGCFGCEWLKTIRWWMDTYRSSLGLTLLQKFPSGSSWGAITDIMDQKTSPSRPEPPRRIVGEFIRIQPA